MDRYLVRKKLAEGGSVNAMVGTEVQKRQFNERLVRIARGGENTTRHVFIGPVEEASGGTGKRARRNRGMVMRTSALRLFLREVCMVPLAMMAGGSVVIAGRVAEFHLLTPELTLRAGAAGPYLIHANMLVAVVLWVVVARLFRLRGGARGRAALSGFLAMLMFEGIAIAHYPESFARLYSEPYVASVLAMFAR